MSKPSDAQRAASRPSPSGCRRTRLASAPRKGCDALRGTAPAPKLRSVPFGAAAYTFWPPRPSTRPVTDTDPSRSKRRPMGSPSLREHTSNTSCSWRNCRSSKASYPLPRIRVRPRRTRGNCSARRQEGKAPRRWADLPLSRHSRKPPTRAPSPHRFLRRSKHPRPCQRHSQWCCLRSKRRPWTTKAPTGTSRPRCPYRLDPDRRWCCRPWHNRPPTHKSTLARRIAPKV